MYNKNMNQLIVAGNDWSNRNWSKFDSIFSDYFALWFEDVCILEVLDCSRFAWKIRKFENSMVYTFELIRVNMYRWVNSSR